MGSVQFQIAPCSSLHFLISTGPFRCGRSYLQGLYSVAPVPSEAVPFVYLASICRSLQCLVSALTQAGGGVLLFRFAGSVTLRGGRGAADRCHWLVWGALVVFRPHWVCPRSRWACVLSPSTLLRLQAALYGAGPVWPAVPVFGYSTKAWTRLGLRFVPSQPEQLRPPGA